ncbi:flagellar protein FliS [Alphaproteobacteria bacterium]|nr:flagellar protein FliS [Alphaproteobacteria bacterium]
MKNKKMLHAYANSEREAVVESDNPHALIAVMYDELLRSMNVFFNNLDKSKADLEARGRALSRSLSIIYALQSSLNFEEGGEIAENLFRLYEYSRQQLLMSAKSEEENGINSAIKSLSEIRDAWRMTASQAKIAAGGDVS